MQLNREADLSQDVSC